MKVAYYAYTSVIATQNSTMIDPRKFARRRRVVMKTQAIAIPRLRKSSFVITSSVSQLLYSWDYENVHLFFPFDDKMNMVLSFTCVRAKTLPEKLQSDIISLTLFSAGMCSPLP